MKTLKQRLINWLLKDLKETVDSQVKMVQLLKVSNERYFAMLKTHENLLEAQIDQFNQLQEVRKQLENTVGDIGIAADISMNKYDPSWAVICIQGKKHDFIKFIDLEDRDLREISSYLRRFDKRNVTADLPHGMSKNEFLKF